MTPYLLAEAQLHMLNTFAIWLTIFPLILIGAILSYSVIFYLREKDRRDRENMPLKEPYSVQRQKVFKVSSEEMDRLFKEFM